MKKIVSLILITVTLSAQAQNRDISFSPTYQSMMIKRNGGMFCDTLPTKFDTININLLSEKGIAFLFGTLSVDLSYLSINKNTEKANNIMRFSNKLISNSEVDSIYRSFLSKDIAQNIDQNFTTMKKVVDSLCIILIDKGFELQIINAIQGILTTEKKYMCYYLDNTEYLTDMEKLDKEVDYHKEKIFTYLDQKVHDKKLLKKYKRDCDRLFKNPSYEKIEKYQKEMIFN